MVMALEIVMVIVVVMVMLVSVVLRGAQSNYIKIVGLGDPVWGIARLDF